MDDLISRKEAIDWIKGWFDTDKHYHPYSRGKTIPTCEVMDILERVPSAERKSGRYVDLSERVTATYYDCEYEEWSEKTVTVEEVLDTTCDDYTVVEMPSAEPQKMKGKWIYGEHDIAMCDGYMCNQCGFFVPWDYAHKSINYIDDYKFCPNCGAEMENGNG